MTGERTNYAGAAPDASGAAGAVLRGTACVLTPAGRGAVAVIAAAGPAAWAAVENCFRPAARAPAGAPAVDRIAFGQWCSRAHCEEVILIRGADDQVEIHCHGGVAAVARIAGALAAAGCQIVRWDEWLAASHGIAIAIEAELALTQATTRRAAALLLAQRSGALAGELGVILRHLRAGEHHAASSRIAALLERAPVGLHLARPWRVAIAGRPNAGKSSLINALLGYQRAIVCELPGTTRDVLAAETAIDGWPVRLSDSAGIRDAADDVEAQGVALALREFEAADLRVWVVDSSGLDHASDPRAAALEDLARAGWQLDAAPLVVLNKVDLLRRAPSLDECGVVWTSAATGFGMDRLLEAIAQRLVPQPPAPDAPLPFTQGQYAALRRAAGSLACGDVRAAAEAIAAIDGGGRLE
jgi:tRNA modification GTPase